MTLIELQEAITIRVNKLNDFTLNDNRMFTVSEKLEFLALSSELRKVLLAIKTDSVDPLLNVFHDIE